MEEARVQLTSGKTIDQNEKDLQEKKDLHNFYHFLSCRKLDLVRTSTASTARPLLCQASWKGLTHGLTNNPYHLLANEIRYLVMQARQQLRLQNHVSQCQDLVQVWHVKLPERSEGGKPAGELFPLITCLTVT